jgi:heme/copper-type cytochrome/quinol oxidase subunit 3
MSAHDLPINHSAEGTSLGVPTMKLCWWVFLSSECMFFGSLLATYFSLKPNRVSSEPAPNMLFDIDVTSISTFVLLASSFLMVLAVEAIAKGDMGKTRLWLAGTALFGLIFIGFQAYEFTEFYYRYVTHPGEYMTLTSGTFGSSFFTLTGFHGFHVCIGIVWLLALLALSYTGWLTPERALTVEVLGLYWHFVDIVWIVIFTIVYLVEFI